MSLLDGGPDELLVYPEVEKDDGYGGTIRVPGPTPVTVRGRVQPIGTQLLGTEDSRDGQELDTRWRFIGRTFPTGPWGKVVFDGREWDLDGEPKRHAGSTRTRHVTVTLRARAPKAV